MKTKFILILCMIGHFLYILFGLYMTCNEMPLGMVVIVVNLLFFLMRKDDYYEQYGSPFKTKKR